MLTYCFESSLIPRTLAKCRRNDLAVVDTEGHEKAVREAVSRGVWVLFFVRGISGPSTLVDNPSAGRFRGSITVDWTNNRIGIRCLNAGSGNTRYDLVYFDYVYGVL